MNESETLMQAALTMADAISRRDVKLIASLLAPGFLHRTPGGETKDADAFCATIQQIPGEIAFVRIVDANIDMADGGALMTGIQHARVRVKGQDIDDRRAFVDWFVKTASGWKFRVAVDLPTSPPSPDE
jgi:hypothetical protein